MFIRWLLSVLYKYLIQFVLRTDQMRCCLFALFISFHIFKNTINCLLRFPQWISFAWVFIFARNFKQIMHFQFCFVRLTKDNSVCCQCHGRHQKKTCTNVHIYICVFFRMLWQILISIIKTRQINHCDRIPWKHQILLKRFFVYQT